MADIELLKLLTEGGVALVAAGAGAFLGAYFAYRNERKAKQEHENERQIASAQRALFVLAAQLNALLIYQQKVLDPVRDDQMSWFTMVSKSTKDYTDLKQEIDGLGFLLGTEYDTIAFEVLIADSQFHSAIQTIQQRIDFATETLQPKIEKAILAGDIGDMGNGVIVGSKDAIEQALGPRGVGTAKSTAEAVFDHVDKTVESLQVTTTKLCEVLSNKFPGVRFSRASIVKDS